jgi:hypothetical protein
VHVRAHSDLIVLADEAGGLSSKFRVVRTIPIDHRFSAQAGVNAVPEAASRKAAKLLGASPAASNDDTRFEVRPARAARRTARCAHQRHVAGAHSARDGGLHVRLGTRAALVGDAAEGLQEAAGRR